MTAKIESAETAKKFADLIYHHAAYRGQRPLALHPFEVIAIEVIERWIEARDEQMKVEGLREAAEICEAKATHRCGAAFCEECEVAAAHVDDAEAIRAEIERRGGKA